MAFFIKYANVVSHIVFWATLKWSFSDILLFSFFHRRRVSTYRGAKYLEFEEVGMFSLVSSLYLQYSVLPMKILGLNKGLKGVNGRCCYLIYVYCLWLDYTERKTSVWGLNIKKLAKLAKLHDFPEQNNYMTWLISRVGKQGIKSHCPFEHCSLDCISFLYITSLKYEKSLVVPCKSIVFMFLPE